VQLQHQVAVVTGGAVRIGREISLALSRAGMRVCVHYNSSAPAAEQTAEEIRSAGGEVTIVQADLSHPGAAADKVISAAIRTFGQVDVLINNASIFESERLDELTIERWERHERINLTAPAFLCQRFVAAQRQRRGKAGAIVNIVDWRALRPQPGHLSYTLSKAGLLCLTQLLAQELAPTIRVNAIAPGAILPPPGAGPDYEQRMKSLVPLGRVGHPQDIVEAVLFLLRSDFVTGETVHVTGGQQLTVSGD
jgi:NAD(P)-dependent dehydrogenase (short-subunit alcohol dehydrogenase family)